MSALQFGVAAKHIQGGTWQSGLASWDIDLTSGRMAFSLADLRIAPQLRQALPPAVADLDKVSGQCLAGRWTTAGFACSEFKVTLSASEQSILTLSGDAQWEFLSRTTVVNIDVGDSGRVTFRWQPAEQGLRVTAKRVPLTQFPDQFNDWLTGISALSGLEVSQGRLNADITWLPAPDRSSQLTGSLDVEELSFHNGAGTLASELLDLKLTFDATHSPRGVKAEVELQIATGGAYAEPVFIDLNTAPVRLAVHIDAPADSDVVNVSPMLVEHVGVADVSGHFDLGPGLQVTQATVGINQLEFPAAWNTWVAGFLVGSPMAEMETSGRGAGRVVVKRGELAALSFDMHDLQLEARNGRFALYDGALTARWRAAADQPETSRISLGGGHLFGAGFGATEIPFETAARYIRLLEPVRIPGLGGALNVDAFSVEDLLSDTMDVAFEARLEPIELGQLTHALGWPARLESGVGSLDLVATGRLDFEPMTPGRFPCLDLAYQAARAGGTAFAELAARALAGGQQAGQRAQDEAARCPFH